MHGISKTYTATGGFGDIPYAAPDLWHVILMAKYYGFAVIISSRQTMYDPCLQIWNVNELINHVQN